MFLPGTQLNWAVELLRSMRRLGGLVLAISLAITGCATSGDTETTRSSASPPPTQVAPTTSTAPAGDATTTSAPAHTAAPADAFAIAAETDNPVLPTAAQNVSRPAAPTPTPPSGPQPTGHIEIPAIGLSHATYEGIDLAIINYGPSHWPGTAWPGHKGNTVFPGHRTTYSRPFWDIDHLVPGDEVIFTTREGRFTYRVTETLIVSEYDSWIVDPTERATFTIFGCHPKGSARQRYVAKGELVSAPAPRPTTTTTTTAPSTTTTTEPEDEGLLGGLFG